MSTNCLRPVTAQTSILSVYSPKKRYSISFPLNSPFTKQEFRDECDINTLMSKYMATGELPNLNERAPQYLDATAFDYQSSMQQIASAHSLFNELPSQLRLQFDNDPGSFLDFCSHEENRDELKKMGLLKPQREWVDPNPSQISVVAPVPPSAPSEPLPGDSSPPK
ncbi:MAG: internal scaffolding protein [Microviridae sp.]|nr:MAG: internal scaffolding protein [Microviridae sp.]